MTTPREFEDIAGKILGRHYGVAFAPGRIPGVPKLFDLVSPDRTTVGDAKYFTLVRGVNLPPAKFSVIAEHVWLLDKTNARERFLVFGNDRRVPELWLAKYGDLAGEVRFYFIDAGERLSRLR